MSAAFDATSFVADHECGLCCALVGHKPECPRANDRPKDPWEIIRGNRQHLCTHAGARVRTASDGAKGQKLVAASCPSCGLQGGPKEFGL